MQDSGAAKATGEDASAAVSSLVFLCVMIQCVLLNFLTILSATSSENHYMHMGAVCGLSWPLSCKFFRLVL